MIRWHFLCLQVERGVECACRSGGRGCESGGSDGAARCPGGSRRRHQPCPPQPAEPATPPANAAANAANGRHQGQEVACLLSIEFLLSFVTSLITIITRLCYLCVLLIGCSISLVYSLSDCRSSLCYRLCISTVLLIVPFSFALEQHIICWMCTNCSILFSKVGKW